MEKSTLKAGMDSQKRQGRGSSKKAEKKEIMCACLKRGPHDQLKEPGKWASSGRKNRSGGELRSDQRKFLLRTFGRKFMTLGGRRIENA